MKNPIRRFELLFLRPLWFGAIVFTAVAAIQTRWWWTGGGLVAIMYVGVIGAKLHPALSGPELAEGPLKGNPAVAEMHSMSEISMRALVVHACNRIAHFSAVAFAATLLAVLDWRWYAALPVAFVGSALLGGILRVVFTEN